MTRKRKILFLFPFSIITIWLICSWALFLFGDFVAVFQHYLGLLLYGLLLYFLLGEKNLHKTLVCTGLYLVLTVINFISFFPFVASTSVFMTIATVKIYTPGINWVAFFIFILYAILNFDTLSDIYWDYKESKGKL